MEGEDHRARQQQSLKCAAVAWCLYREIGHNDEAWARDPFSFQRERFGAAVFAALWQELGLGEMPEWLVQRAASARRTQTDAANLTEDERAGLAVFRVRLNQYGEMLEPAAAENPAAAAWQAIAALGDALLTEAAHGWLGIDWAVLRKSVAESYNKLGNALETAGDKPGALAAYVRAVELQPDFAMWRRNQAGTLIELGQFAAARIAIDAARALEPDAPRLAELDAELAAALGAG